MNALIQNATDMAAAINWTALLLDTLLKSFLVLAVAALICWFARRASAAVRYSIWFVALLALPCLPLLTALVPAWHQPIWSLSARPDSLNEVALSLRIVPEQPVPNAPPTSVAQFKQEVAKSAAAPASNGVAVKLIWLRAGLLLWVLGTSASLIFIALSHLRLKALRKDAVASTNPQWDLLLKESAESLSMNRSVTLLLSTQNSMPVTWGIKNPVILLPSEATQWPEQRLRVVLLHELAHIERRDCLTQLFASVIASLYWFNPLIWVALQGLRTERERACDDLVLSSGCKASDYAGHLVAIARTFSCLPRISAIAMARPSQLESRVTAIIDSGRSRRAPHPLILAAVCVAAFGLVTVVAAQKPTDDTDDTQPAKRPWYDARLRAYFVAKSKHAHQLADLEKKKLAADIWPYFEAGVRGDWKTVENLWSDMRRRAYQYTATTHDEGLVTIVWQTVLETDLAWQEFSHWKQKYLLQYGNEITRSIPKGAIYFGGTDPGRGVITAFADSHAEGKPFFTLTQNALADGMYRPYVETTYGKLINTYSEAEMKRAFDDYTADAALRLKHDLDHPKEPKQILPDESVQVLGPDGKPQAPDGSFSVITSKIQVSGQVAVMAINGRIAKTIFDKNPTREFYIEESFALDWMYPHLTPHGLIMKINRKPLGEISEEVVKKDHDHWSRQIKAMLGDALEYDTPLKSLVAFQEKIRIDGTMDGFKGDPLFLKDNWAQIAYSKMRSAQAGVYVWQMKHAASEDTKARMAKEADFAFRQAVSLCPNSPESVFGYANFLVEQKRLADAVLVADLAARMPPGANGRAGSFQQLAFQLEDLQKSAKPDK